MANCWYCGIELKPGITSSKEHVIPDAFGGRLTSFELLCEEHNKFLGKTLDSDLYKQLAPFLKLINPIRDRPDDSFLDLIRENGESTKRRSGFKPFYLVEIHLPDGQVIITSHKNRQEVEKFIKKKGREFDKKGMLHTTLHISQEPTISQLFVTNQAGTNRNIFGGKPILKSLSKIVINYYLFCGGKEVSIRPLIEAVKSDDVNTITSFARMYNAILPFHKLSEDEMSHIIYIKGDSRRGVLIAYIEVLNFVNALLVIDTNYTGEPFECKYCYDLIKSKAFDKNIDIDKTREFFIHFPVLKLTSNRRIGQGLFNRFTKILNKYQNVFKNR